MYRFLDSGDGFRFEQVGSLVLKRPLSRAIWQSSNLDYSGFDALIEYCPKKRAWHGCGSEYSEAERFVDIGGISMKLWLQQNGQIGFFPEHFAVKDMLGQAKRVLNLFAYTGYLSIVALATGAEVTHCELSKSVLDIFSQNLDANSEVPCDKLRIIKDDAYKFIAKEEKRDSRYDLIICDPPNFSRDGSKSYELLAVLPMLLSNLRSIMESGGRLLFSFHGSDIAFDMVENLATDRDMRILNTRILSLTGARKRVDLGCLVELSFS